MPKEFINEEEQDKLVKNKDDEKEVIEIKDLGIKQTSVSDIAQNE